MEYICSLQEQLDKIEARIQVLSNTGLGWANQIKNNPTMPELQKQSLIKNVASQLLLIDLLTSERVHLANEWISAVEEKRFELDQRVAELNIEEQEAMEYIKSHIFKVANMSKREFNLLRKQMEREAAAVTEKKKILQEKTDLLTLLEQRENKNNS